MNSSIEDRLRDAYRGAADTVRPDGVRRLDEQSVALHSFRSTRGRRAPRRVLIPLGAAASVALVGVLLGVLAGARQSAERNPVPPAQTGAPAGRFLVAVSSTDKHSLTVHNKFSGASVATIAAPSPGMVFAALATGDGRHYVAVLWRKGACRSWIYQFRLNAAGQPGALTPYPLATTDRLVHRIAVSADDSTLAYASEPCPKSSTAAEDLSVVRVASLATRTWSIPSQISIASLSLTEHGRQLAYIFGPARQYGSGAYVLPASAASGPALQRSRVVATGAQLGRDKAIFSGAITPDGADVYFISSGTGRSYGHGWQVRMASLATRKISVVGRYPGIPGYLMTGPAVRHALVVVLSKSPVPVPSSTARRPSARPTPSPSRSRRPTQSAAASVSPSSSPPPPPQGSATPSPAPSAQPYAIELELISLPRASSSSLPTARFLDTGQWNPVEVVFAW